MANNYFYSTFLFLKNPQGLTNPEGLIEKTPPLLCGITSRVPETAQPGLQTVLKPAKGMSRYCA